MKKVMLAIGFALILIGCNSHDIEKSPEKEIPVVEIMRDNLFGAGSEKIPKQDLIIKSQSEWTNLQTAINSVNSSGIAETEIDFTKYTVIAVFDKLRSNGGWSIDITAISETADKIIVSVSNLQTGNGTAVMTQPFHIVKIPVSKKEIEFNHSEDSGQKP
jgi:hypothetical protein